MTIHPDVSEVLVSTQEIAEICERLGKKISEDYAGKKLLLVSVLRGAVVFLSDLMRQITCDCQIDFMAVSSYHGGTKTSGFIEFKKDLDIDPSGYHILIVEDILDSGLTLSYLKRILSERGPESIRICTFLDKPSNRQVELTADYVGKTIPDAFAIGYGLDYAEKYRNLPYVGVLNPKIYEGK